MNIFHGCVFMEWVLVQTQVQQAGMGRRQWEHCHSCKIQCQPLLQLQNAIPSSATAVKCNPKLCHISQGHQAATEKLRASFSAALTSGRAGPSIREHSRHSFCLNFCFTRPGCGCWCWTGCFWELRKHFTRNVSRSRWVTSLTWQCHVSLSLSHFPPICCTLKNSKFSLSLTKIIISIFIFISTPFSLSFLPGTIHPIFLIFDFSLFSLLFSLLLFFKVYSTSY